MAYTITKLADGDLSLGNLRGEFVSLQPAVSDYATGGYLIQGIGGATESTGNVGLDKVLDVVPGGDASGYTPKWNPATSKLRMLYNGSSSALPGQQVEIPANTDISAYSFQLIVVGL